jgi:hypothetical protein
MRGNGSWAQRTDRIALNTMFNRSFSHCSLELTLALTKRNGINKGGGRDWPARHGSNVGVMCMTNQAVADMRACLGGSQELDLLLTA